jgi:flagellar hook-associated protein 3 FlgL
MRVTGNSFVNSFLDELNLLSARQQRLQQQISTGQRITAPEDDPAAMQRTLDLRDEKKGVEQYLRNISTLQSRATASFGALKGVKNISDRAGEIATLATGLRSPEELKAYAAEVTQMIQSAVQSMNTKVGDRYLFGGTQTTQPPFTVATDANGNVTSVTYQGNASVAQSEIAAGSMIAVDVPGENASGSGEHGLISDSRTGADFFNHLISLQNHLLAGDTSSVASIDQPGLKLDEDNLIFQISHNGSVQTRLETATTIANTSSDSLNQMISKEADTDITETIVQLSQTQNTYQAALQSGAKILNMSLLDFLP